MEGDLGSSLMQLGDTINILQVNFRNVLASNQWHGYAMCQGLLDQIFKWIKFSVTGWAVLTFLNRETSMVCNCSWPVIKKQKKRTEHLYTILALDTDNKD